MRVVLVARMNENLEVLQLHPTVNVRQDLLMMAQIINNVQLATIAA